MHTVKSKKNNIVFSYNKILACIFGFNDQFIKVTKTWPIFQKNPKNILFVFSIWDYEFICKRILDIKKR
jgi:hypothetical protein